MTPYDVQDMHIDAVLAHDRELRILCERAITFRDGKLAVDDPEAFARCEQILREKTMDYTRDYTKAAYVTLSFDGGNHPVRGWLYRCGQCGALVLEADQEMHYEYELR